MIRRLSETIKTGSKFFIGHQDTNSHDGRTEVGTVLSSFLKEINGKMSSVIVGHFPNEDQVRDMDACSMEADISVDTENNVVEDINEVTGIALANSDVNSPAFPGALRLSAIQCFENTKNRRKEDKEIIMAQETITFKDVESFVRDHNVWPHQLYTEQDLRSDRNFGVLFDDNSKMKTENESLEKELEKSKKETKKLQKDQQDSVAIDRLKDLMPKDLTDKQKEFITKRFKPEILEDVSDDSLKKYIEEGRNDFAETAKLFGVADDKQSGTGSKDDTGNEDKGSGDGDSTPEDKALKLIGVE